jgi:hypothetical protein
MRNNFYSKVFTVNMISGITRWWSTRGVRNQRLIAVHSLQQPVCFKQSIGQPPTPFHLLGLDKLFCVFKTHF